VKKKLLAEGLGKSLQEDLVRPFDIGDEGDRTDTGRTHEISVLLSLRDKEKMLAIDEALEKIREGTYGVCEECGDEIGGGPVESHAPGYVLRNLSIATGKGNSPSEIRRREARPIPDW